MQRKVSICVNILLISSFACNTAPVLSRSVRHEKYSEDKIESHKNENHFHFDVCKFPTLDDTTDTSLEETEKIEYNVEEIRTVTEDVIIYMKKKVRAVERKVRCKYQIQNLREKELNDVLKIRSFSSTNLNGYPNITKTYLDIAALTFLLHNLDPKLSLAAKKCCLPYPKDIADVLRNTILTKWYNIQDRHGDPIGRLQCNVCVHIDFNPSTGCDNVRDVIYVLLQHARNVLKDSRSLINGLKRN